VADPTVQRNTDMTLLARRRPAAALMLASLVVLGLVQLCSGIREGASIVTEKVKTLQQQEAERLAEWKPVRDMRCCFSASTTAVTRVAAVANMSLAADGPEGLRPAGKAAWSRTARSGQCGARPARAVLRSQWTVGAVCYGS
jgi:hypothetical protein